VSGVSGTDGGAAQVEQVFREAYGAALATLVRFTGDIDVAEDAVQDAFVVASDKWRKHGIPTNPAGWIITTARNRVIDGWRRARRGSELYQEVGVLLSNELPEDEGPVMDDRLRLIFTCCHPSLRMEHRVALTLRLLGGLSLEEVARSFLVTDAAMAKRLVRAKFKIKAAGIPYRIPKDADIPDRLLSVLAVLYLIYNTGADSSGRVSLRREAIRLTRVLVDLMPDEPESLGLLALMLLNEARMSARTSGPDLVLLRDQDRERWDRRLIVEGQDIVRRFVPMGRPGQYQIQAAIQAVHCEALTFEETDWNQIAALYDQLYALTPTPVVALNRAIAMSEVAGPESGLIALDAIGSALDSYHLMHATRGTTLRRLGRLPEARLAFQRAADLAVAESDKRFIARQIEKLGERLNDHVEG